MELQTDGRELSHVFSNLSKKKAPGLATDQCINFSLLGNAPMSYVGTCCHYYA